MREPREVSSGMIARIASMQDRAGLLRSALGGRLRGLPAHRAAEPQGHPHRLPARLRHDPVAREERVHRQQEEAHPLQLLHRPRLRREGRHLRPRRPAHEAGERLQERGAGVRDGEARHPAPRTGGLVQVHHRPPAQEGARGLLQDGRGSALHLRLGHRAGEPRWREAPRAHALPHARGAAPPPPAGVARPASTPTCARPSPATPSPTRATCARPAGTSTGTS